MSKITASLGQVLKSFGLGREVEVKRGGEGPKQQATILAPKRWPGRPMMKHCLSWF
jgi:hypothetical protein